jgi:O-methyltransferase
VAASNPADLYLELLKECLLGRAYGPEVVHVPDRPEDPGMREAIDELTAVGIAVTRPHTVAEETYELGNNFVKGFPERAATMIGRVRLNNVHRCVERAIQDGVPGDLIETGVWRGGVPILMRAIVKARGEDRLVWVADSFVGLPDPDLAAHPLDREFIGHEKFDVGIDEVRAQFERYRLLDDGVRFLEGWFKDTLPTVAGREFAVVRLDGDMYGSTIEALTELYPLLSTGGFLIVDDYHAYHACSQAVTDYRDAHGITEPIEPIDWTGVYWRKTS